MNIQGFNKLTLLDYPGLTACTVFTGGCDLRCPFCHNSGLVLDPRGTDGYTVDEVLTHLKKRKGILDGICVSGGEPILQPDLEDFLRKIRDIGGYKIKLDTNGTRPKVLRSLIEDGLVDYVAMDIKNCREKYGVTVGFDSAYDITPIEESIEILRQGSVDYEFRTTVSRTFHTSEDIENIGKWLCGQEKFYLQQFKDSGQLISGGIEAYDEHEMKALLDTFRQFVPNAQLRGI